MKKNVFLLLIGVVLVYIGVAIGKTSNNEDIIKDDTEASVIKHENSLSMMLETEANSGNYEMTTRSEWPTEGYVFNTELSKCENGGELSWDNEKKVVLMSGNVSDKCYVYFDRVPILLADYVKANHNNTVFMARKNEIAAPSPLVGCNKWDYSELNTKNLNVNFLQSFTLKNISQISDTTWQAHSSSTKIGLVSYQDYQFAFSSNYWDLSYDGDYRTNNWLYNSNDRCSHTITPSDSGDITVYLIINDNFYNADYLPEGQHGGQLFEHQSASYCAIYPSFYLNSDVTYKSGTGTISNPIIIGN